MSIINGITNPLIAASTGDADTLRVLIEAGADINERHPGGKTALLASIIEGEPECLQILIDAGAALTQKYGRYTSTEAAIVFACPQCLEMLLDRAEPPRLMELAEDLFADYADDIDRSGMLMNVLNAGKWEKHQVIAAAKTIDSRTARRVLAMLEAEELGSANIAAAPAAGDVAI